MEFLPLNLLFPHAQLPEGLNFSDQEALFLFKEVFQDLRFRLFRLLEPSSLDPDLQKEVHSVLGYVLAKKMIDVSIVLEVLQGEEEDDEDDEEDWDESWQVLAKAVSSLDMPKLGRWIAFLEAQTRP